MGNKTKKGKGRLDKFYHLAKEQGYRSRAAFKLVQLNRKYGLLGNCRALLDLCAAPGGWLQVAAQNMPMASLIVGVDLVPIKPIRGVKTMLGDITTQACRSGLKKLAGGNSFDVVVHDGAPNVGGAWSQEAYSQAALVLDSLRLATEFLAPKGTFVSKVFRSKDYNALLYACNQLFNKVESTKPTASRNASAEIFIICQGYKAPSKIDPRLLDPRYLFQEVTDAPRVMGPEALLRQKIKQHRHRTGYEDGVSVLHKAVPALAFLSASAPVEMLGQVTKIVLDGPGSWEPVPTLPHAKDLKELAHLVRQHPSTTHEVRQLCTDLQVLGRSEFKALLKWRATLLKELGKELRQAATGVEEDEEEEQKKKKAEQEEGKQAVDPEEAMLQEMADVKASADQRAKRERKKQREAKRKARVRALQLGLGQAPPIDDDPDGPDSMFNLRSMTGTSKTLARVADTPALGERELAALEAAGSDDEEESESDDESEDEDAAALREEMENEAALEDSYRHYLQRKGHRDEAQKEKRKRLGMDGELDEDDGGEDAEAMTVGTEDEEGEETDVAGDGEEEEEEEQQQQPSKRQKQDKGKQQQKGKEGSGLLVSLDENRAGVAKSGPAMAAQWFSQELFDDPNLAGDDEEDSDEEEQMAGPQHQSGAGKQQQQQSSSRRDAPAQSRGGAEEESEEEGPARLSTPAAAEGKQGKNKDGFEVVPQQKRKKKDDESDSGTDSDDEFEALDDQGKAEVLALAKRMLHRKEKESIMDAAYNRYAFHDTEKMPRWFKDDEAKHMQPILPVSKEEVEAEKARLKAVDARPIKKVAEAKARQHRRAVSKLQAAREKAESVAAQEDVPMNSKMREIERIYAKARASGKKGGKDSKKAKKGKGKGPPMDKRMKKDKRGLQAAERRKKKGGKKK